MVHDQARLKLDVGQMHFLRLAQRGADADGWAPVSPQVWTIIDTVPAELLEREPDPAGGGRCRLTDAGETLVLWS